MWARFRHYFKGFPAQEKVAQLMVMYGLRVHEGSVYAGDIRLSDTAMARAAGVDRRGVAAAAQTIDKKDELKRVFDKLRPPGHPPGNAPPLGRGAVRIGPPKPPKARVPPRGPA